MAAKHQHGVVLKQCEMWLCRGWQAKRSAGDRLGGRRRGSGARGRRQLTIGADYEKISNLLSREVRMLFPVNWLNNQLADDTVLQLTPAEHGGRRGFQLEADPEMGADEPLATWDILPTILIEIILDYARQSDSLIFVEAPAGAVVPIAVANLCRLGFVRLDQTMLVFDPASAPDPHAHVPEAVRKFADDTLADMQELVAAIHGGTARYYAEQTLRDYRQRRFDLFETWRPKS